MQADEFERCWHENVRRVTAYVERHVGREASYDVVSSTFLVAWRTAASLARTSTYVAQTARAPDIGYRDMLEDEP